ncbi:uncharacterized protein KY384_001216 [Bacidia gigantensis]|uniref:uncharacterized protein n=1 Tax=Bacidia gigantensis TaxID=2732470 RepID=UPI001D04EDFE|nr:uncharacterized protein KY384_001216 [Bacidia gigantensis]KAG8534371.1 hypothetical protein KY384_001216 [Bacidia gigantensis]
MEPLTPALPTEVLTQIFALLSQHTLHACTLTSRAWYEAAVPFLYRSPSITGKGFDSFVAAVCPSVNPRIRHNGLAELVRVLDMSKLVHNGRKSLTARLLGRMKYHLVAFIAPQATFGINSLASLSHCEKLETLDLSFVSEAIPYRSLFNSLCRLKHLHVLHLPRAFQADHDIDRGSQIALRELERDAIDLSAEVFYRYPPALRALSIHGGIDSVTLMYLVRAPTTLTSLSLSHCSRFSTEIVRQYLNRLKTHTSLEHLQLGTGLFDHHSSFTAVLPPFDHLASLSIEAPLLLPYVHGFALRSDSDFRPIAEGTMGSPWPRLHTITVLGPNNPPPTAHYYNLKPNEVYKAIDSGIFPALRKLRIDSKLGWSNTSNSITDLEDMTEDKQDLNDLLEALASEDADLDEHGEMGQTFVRPEEAGVFIFCS